jgi:glycopeptide antibiotics resistance protein
MVKIHYPTMVIVISILWVLTRIFCCRRAGFCSWKRELQLMLVYICIIVVVRFTFCPFGKIDGKIQPLLFDPGQFLPFRLNFLPFVYLFDYPDPREILLNIIGNTAMFIPLGIVWPCVFKQLDTHKKVIAAGVGYSLLIEIFQLPFFDRVSDIDDLLLNSLGFLMGYGIYLLVRTLKRIHVRRRGRK